MKRLLDKTWAKLAAFFLTLLFIALTALGGIGIGILASYNVFLDGGSYLRQTMYESQCSSAIHNAYYYLYSTMANAGLLADDTPSMDTSDTSAADITDEEQQKALEDMPRAFSERFSREDTDCHLAVIDKNTRETTFENFTLTDSDKPLYSIQETFTLTYADGSEEELTIAADLLPANEFPDYSYLVMTWLLNHIGLTVFLTVLFLLLTLLCFGFSMASAGHWAGHEGIHLTWLDKNPGGRVAAGAAVRVFHRLGHLLLRVGTARDHRGAAALPSAVPVRVRRPVQSRDGAAGLTDWPSPAAAVAHYQGCGTGAVPQPPRACR